MKVVSVRVAQREGTLADLWVLFEHFRKADTRVDLAVTIGNVRKLE